MLFTLSFLLGRDGFTAVLPFYLGERGNTNHYRERKETMMNNTIQVRVSDSMKAKIEAFAAANEMNVSEACRNLISMELNRKETVFAASDFVKFLQSVGFNALDEIEPETLNDAAKFYAKEPDYWRALGERELHLKNEFERSKRENPSVKHSYAARVAHCLKG